MDHNPSGPLFLPGICLSGPVPWQRVRGAEKFRLFQRMLEKSRLIQRIPGDSGGFRKADGMRDRDGWLPGHAKGSFQRMPETARGGLRGFRAKAFWSRGVSVRDARGFLAQRYGLPS